MDLIEFAISLFRPLIVLVCFFNFTFNLLNFFYLVKCKGMANIYSFTNQPVAFSANISSTVSSGNNVTIINSNTASDTPISILQPLQATTSTTQLILGRDNSAFNSAFINFYYLEPDYFLNQLTLGINGQSGVTIDGSNNLTVPGLITSNISTGTNLIVNNSASSGQIPVKFFQTNLGLGETTKIVLGRVDLTNFSGALSYKRDISGDPNLNTISLGLFGPKSNTLTINGDGLTTLTGIVTVSNTTSASAGTTSGALVVAGGIGSSGLSYFKSLNINDGGSSGNLGMGFRWNNSGAQGESIISWGTGQGNSPRLSFQATADGISYTQHAYMNLDGFYLGNMVASGSIRVDDTAIYLRPGVDINHGLIYGSTNNGPDIFGVGGGRLLASGTARLSWNTTGVSVNGSLTARDLTLTYPVNGGSVLANNNTDSGTDAYSGFFLGNNTANKFVMFLNSSTRTDDGGTFTGTLRNDSGDLRLQAKQITTLSLSASTALATLTGSLSVNGNLTVTSGTLSLNNATSNLINLGAAGTSAPGVGTLGSIGQKLILYQGSSVDPIEPPYGFGIDGATLWAVVPSTAQHLWYTGTTPRMALTQSGLYMTDTPIYLRPSGDANHGLKFGITNDGPELFGLGGGRLLANGTARLSWNTSGVSVNGSLSASGTSSLQAITATVIQASGGLSIPNTAANTTATNQGVSLFGSSQFLYGMDLGYNGSRYRTRLYSPSNSDIALSTAADNATTQAGFTDRVIINGNTGNVNITSTTATTSRTTGALVVNGGVGINGGIFIGTNSVTDNGTTLTEVGINCLTIADTNSQHLFGRNLIVGNYATISYNYVSDNHNANGLGISMPGKNSSISINNIGLFIGPLASNRPVLSNTSRQMATGRTSRTTTGVVSISFPFTFTSAPNIIVSIEDSVTGATVVSRNNTATGFEAVVGGTPGANTSIIWIAIN